MSDIETLPQADTSRRLVAILVKQLGISESAIGPTVRLIGGASPECFGMDSLDLVELTMLAEEHFGIEIPDADADQIASATFAQLVDYVHSCRETANG